MRAYSTISIFEVYTRPRLRDVFRVRALPGPHCSSLPMLDNLTQRMARVVKTLRGEARLTEANTQEMLREVRLALLEADVALPVVREFIAQGEGEGARRGSRSAASRRGRRSSASCSAN